MASATSDVQRTNPDARSNSALVVVGQLLPAAIARRRCGCGEIDVRSRFRPDHKAGTGGPGLKYRTGMGQRWFRRALRSDRRPASARPRPTVEWGSGLAHWRQNRHYGPWGFYGGSVPTYWVWVPGSAVFDYPFADWRGPTGGWGNP